MRFFAAFHPVFSRSFRDFSRPTPLRALAHIPARTHIVGSARETYSCIVKFETGVAAAQRPGSFLRAAASSLCRASRARGFRHFCARAQYERPRGEPLALFADARALYDTRRSGAG